ncbi:hypothetical protein [Bradyrhizobium sp. CCGE-LA001]|uniref:hypothetical protein n=1 Tax=Bradyrhizobium sp. CCGE-LA001 TaxID=1223566 RepID=UPI0002AA72F4|nr:hypothetical protein [Bradyrhizobium sp. CCGE-LA001]AMA59980.1 hypothetical protein BCCGELA001_29530 [Bradyrhizobium sp. CCGE-LA001]
MTHPGEQFYSKAVRRDEAIVQVAPAELLTEAAAYNGTRRPKLATPDQLTELAAGAVRAPAAEIVTIHPNTHQEVVF